MKNFRSMLLASALVIVPGAAIAADMPVQEPVPEPYVGVGGWYLRGDAGWSFLDWDGGKNDNAFTGGGGFGYKWNEWFRSDIRADYSGTYGVQRRHDMSTVSVLGNTYVDFPLTPWFKPYIGGGIGYGWVFDSPRGDENGFTWALMGGATFDVTPNVAIDVGYRFRDFLIKGPNVYDHSVTAGLRYMF